VYKGFETRFGRPRELPVCVFVFPLGHRGHQLTWEQNAGNFCGHLLDGRSYRTTSCCFSATQTSLLIFRYFGKLVPRMSASSLHKSLQENARKPSHLHNACALRFFTCERLACDREVSIILPVVRFPELAHGTGYRRAIRNRFSPAFPQSAS
jgi:hypothetical protein